MEVPETKRQRSIEETEGNVNVRKKKEIELLNTNRPALILENLFGIFRFRVQNNEVVPINKTRKILCIILLSIYIVLFSLSIRKSINITAKFVDMMDEVLSVVLMIQYILCSIRTSLFFNQENIKILTALVDLDEKLYLNTNQNFYKKSRRVTIKVVFILLLVHTVVSILDLFTDGSDVDMSKIVILPVYMEQSLEISVFCLMIMMLTRRLKVINNYLAKFIDEKDNSKASVFIVREKKDGRTEEFNLIGRASSDNMKIRDLAVTYDIIGETCALINEVFNLPICMALIATFMYVVITIWSTLGYYRNSSSEGNTASLATIILWCITAMCLITFISMTCEKLLLARTETKVLVNKIIMDYNLPKTMRVQAKAFMELIEAWPLRIYIYDMFSVDITLILKYISVSTTYLIVIIQISHYI
ncbi:hypothetical protein ABMA28_002605 [Loxostege sticticalis]|uniref:Gustatory receptor n=1 Tax=Loxostege sticticalis TaxID=481309 RepID=A0ABD0SXF1_LOXSC